MYMNFNQDKFCYRISIASLLLIVVAVLSLTSCNQTTSSPSEPPTKVGDITTARLLNIQSEPGAWLTGGRDYQQSYYSPLTTINKQNIQQLGFAWEYEVNTTRMTSAPNTARPISNTLMATTVLAICALRYQTAPRKQND